ESGVTVLLSSHILAEVQQICSSVTIIGNGRMLASGKVDDLIGASTSYRVRVPDRDGAVRRLEEAGFTIHPDGDSMFRVETNRPPGDITRTLGESQVWLSELTPVRPDLETVFLDLTSGEALGEAPGEGDVR
ncbi:MAG: ABC transporter ATP-binding protein, partial [Nocardioides sp.]